MGSGFKDFAAGDVLTAADVDGYLMRQTVMTFADASARDTALSGVLDEGMVAYLEDVNALTVYNGSAWVAVIDSDVLTVDTSNNRVGINDSSPSYALDVTGDINATADVRIGGDSLPRGQLAVASSTADFTINSTGVDIINTSVTLTTSRVLQIIAFAGLIDTASTSLVVNFRLESASYGTGTVYQTHGGDDLSTSAPDQRASFIIIYTATFAAGTHNFYLSGVTNTGTCRLNNSSTRPTMLIVNDMGEP